MYESWYPEAVGENGECGVLPRRLGGVDMVLCVCVLCVERYVCFVKKGSAANSLGGSS